MDAFQVFVTDIVQAMMTLGEKENCLTSIFVLKPARSTTIFLINPLKTVVLEIK